MSEGASNEPSITLKSSTQGDVAFSDLMAVLVPSEEGAPAATGAAADGGAGTDGNQAAAAPPAGGGSDAKPAAAEPAATDAKPGGDAAVGTDGKPVPTAGEAAAGGEGAVPGQDRGDPTAGAGDAVSGGAAARPADWTAVADDIIPKLGELSTKYEEKVAATYQAKALTEAREQHAKYFEALEKHPRALKGVQVPRLDGQEGTETLATTEDAKEWQDQLRHILVDEVRDRAAKAMEADATTLNTVHASIELFQNNRDLIPRTKDFDVDLANRFAELATPYEIRVDGKLYGYSIEVQPLIDRLRSQLVAERKAKPAPATAGKPSEPAAAATPAAAGDPPQAGLTSKAGSGDQGEDYSTLFGTIGLPNLRI